MITQALTNVVESAPQLLRGALTTLTIWLCAACIGLAVGSIWGILSCRRLRVTGLSSLIDKATFVLRGIPFYVQLLIAYFVLPDLLGINLSPFCAGALSLGLCSAGYVCQIVRSGINSISTGQWQASYVLGYNTIETIKNIIFPQMLRNIAPALSGELDQLLKATSILSAIGFLELTRVGMNIISREMNPVSTYLFIAVLYLCLSSLINLATQKIERRLNYDN